MVCCLARQYVVDWLEAYLEFVFINLARVFLFVMPLSLLGSRLYGYNGLIVGLVLGNLLSGGLAYFTARHQLHQTEG